MAAPKRVYIGKDMTVKELAKLLEVTESQVSRHLFNQMRIMRSGTQSIEKVFAKQLARELGYELSEISPD